MLYLGRVIDKERGIYKNKTTGYVRFDPTTQEFLPPPLTSCLQPRPKRVPQLKRVMTPMS